jgi:FemAB-related protein (PEP-CTERM system-associated)
MTASLETLPAAAHHAAPAATRLPAAARLPDGAPGREPASGLPDVSASVDDVEWDAFVERQPAASAYHLWRWRGVFETVFGHRSEYLVARERGAITGILPLVVFGHRLFGRFAVSLPFVNYGGVVATSEETARALVRAAGELASRRRLSYIELRHRAQRFPDLASKRGHKVSMVLDLAPEAARVWAGLTSDMRNHIRKAEKRGLTVATGGSELTSAFYEVFRRNMRDLGTPVYPRRFFEEVLAAFPHHARVFLVRHEKTTIAGAVSFTHAGVTEVPWASSLKAARSLYPNNLLYWRIIEHAVAERCSSFDFGRSTPGDGPFVFKQRWGAHQVPLCWEYQLLSRDSLPDRTPRNPRLHAAIAMWKRLPVGVASLLGPRVVRYLP